MSVLSPRPLIPTLVPSLNALLDAVAVPFSIEQPTDLTPSLLLAIFESIIAARLPIPLAVRQSRTRDAKARAMLVLLGVLECDILRGGSSSLNADDSALTGAGGVSVDGWADDIGLGEVDPERLADGGWEETIFIGELLCWLARRKGILPRTRSAHRSRSIYTNHHSYGDEGESVDLSTSLLLHPSPAQKTSSSPPPSVPDIDADFSTLSHITDVPRHPLVHSPEPSFSASATTGTDLSIRARSVSSRTSVSNAHDPDEFDEASHDTLQLHDPRQMMQDAEDDDDRPPTFRPRCIHELEDPSYIRALGAPSFDPSASLDDVSEDDAGNNDLYTPLTPTPHRVRFTGWIEPVDAATELAAFAASHSRTSRSNAGVSTHSRSSRFTQRTKFIHSPSPSPSRSPSPSPSPTSVTKHAPRSLPLSRPTRAPSPPPSPPIHSDPDSDAPFDVSFSTLNNTSTPAKLKPFSRSKPSQAGTRQPSSTGARVGGAGHERRASARSGSYTPSPPSFSSAGGRAPGPSTRSGSATTTPVPLTRNGNGERARVSASAMGWTAEATSTPKTPLGSTARTSTLLTERARLLTELAALKRARALSGGGTGTVRDGAEVRVGR